MSKEKKDQMIWWYGATAAAVALAFVFSGALQSFSIDLSINQSEEIQSTQNTPLFEHPLSGLPIFDKAEPPHVFGVVIDNHEDSWPQNGLNNAFLVIESPVEAGISRMLAFFSEDAEVEKIGPVRSARPYFLDWNNELDALFTHVGGSDAALDLIASGSTFDLNQYWYDSYFWRSNSRLAPHNVFTSTDLLNEYLEKRIENKTAPKLLYGLWSFKKPEATEESIGLHIDFYPPIYTVDWEFDHETGKYLRDQSGQPHLLENEEQIQADNIAVVITSVQIIDSVGRRKIKTIGKGDGYLFQDGGVVEVIWKKESQGQRLRFYSKENDKELKMNPGLTWVEVVPSKNSIEIVNKD